MVVTGSPTRAAPFTPIRQRGVKFRPPWGGHAYRVREIDHGRYVVTRWHRGGARCLIDTTTVTDDGFAVHLYHQVLAPHLGASAVVCDVPCLRQALVIAAGFIEREIE